MKITIGQDMSCYATVEIPDDTPLTRDALEKITEEILSGKWENEEVMFEEDWSTTCAARVVRVCNKQGVNLVEDMAIDPSPFDAGQALMGWLRSAGKVTKVPFDAVINSAVRARLIEPLKMVAHVGTLQLNGNSSIKFEFDCRENATEEEVGLAFFQALTRNEAVSMGYSIKGDNHELHHQ
jgi:hypothetical protein